MDLARTCVNILQKNISDEDMDEFIKRCKYEIEVPKCLICQNIEDELRRAEVKKRVNKVYEEYKQKRKELITEQLPFNYQNCTFDNWKLEYLEKKHNKKIDKVFFNKIKNEFLNILKHNCVLITGRSHTGKTHLMYALIKHHFDLKIKELDWKILEGNINNFYTTNSEGMILQTNKYIEDLYYNYNMIIIDDINIDVEWSKNKRHILDSLFLLIKEMVNRGKYIILISNYKEKELIKALGYNKDKIFNRINLKINFEKLFIKE